MTPESENFEQLKKLLALKRHEVPPPGYYNNFSRNVISRIRAGETAAAAPGASWLERLQQILNPRPAFGLAVCALLIGGIFYSAQMDKSGASSYGNNFATLPTATTASASAFAGNTGSATPGATSLDGATPGDSLFNPMPMAPQQVNWRPFANTNGN